MDDLLADFLTEAGESLADLDLALVRLERAPDEGETLALIFRHVHTIKGTCGFLGLARLERVAHAAENVLVKLRDRQLPASPPVVSVVLAAADRIKLIVAGLAATGTEPEGDDTALIAALAAIAEGQAPQAAAPPPAAEPTATAPAPAAPPAPTQTIRVAVEVLEELMALVGELVLTRNQLLQLVRGQGESALSVPLQRLSQITSDLQEGVMKTRMQPIGGAWNKLPRLVRDLAHELDKKIELAMHGGDTELDRQVLELIKDPLTHMVRNAADHGLETPAERLAAGKPESGRITLRAFHEGGHVMIEIADDGRGMPVDKIRAKVLARGLATEAELAAMSESQVLRFIFRPGFSTAAAVTAVSGRGVGMDVVRSNVERIGGSVELASSAGQGSRFIIKIPLTLAIAAALIVEAGGERFAIPQLAVVELVHAGSGQDGAAARLEHIDGTPVLRLRERLLPLVNLRHLLRLGAGAADAAKDGAAARYVVVAQIGAGQLGIIVDAVFDTEEIVVKPVAPILRHVSMFSGNTILGDGSVIMILDPNGIARAAGMAGEGRADAADAAAPAAGAADTGRTALLLFRAGGEEPKAVPLGDVARIELIPRDRVERAGGRTVTQYRGRLMPLVPLSGRSDRAREQVTVLVFGDADAAGGQGMGVVVDEILDVAEDVLRLEPGSGRPGMLGSAVVAGRATEVIDVAWWRGQAETLAAEAA